MYAAMILALFVASSLLECADAHGFHHPETHDLDPSFDNVAIQKYPMLENKPSFVAAYHRRKLAEDLTFDDSTKTESPICDPKCYFNKKNNQWLSCDDLVCIALAIQRIRV